MDSIVNFIVGIGLGSPAARAVAGGAAGFATQYLAKPSISYTTVGKTSVPKSFALTSSSTSKTPTTYFPWFMWPILFAVVAGIFI